MAIINLSELHPAGSEFFQDSESFLHELTNEEASSIEGGIVSVVCVSFRFQTVFNLNLHSVKVSSICNIHTVI